MKRLLNLAMVMVLSSLLALAAKPGPTARIMVRGAPIRGANGLYFDRLDRLHVASVSGREIVVLDTRNGKIIDRIGPERGVDTPDDVCIGPDGSIYWTSILTGEVGRLKPDGRKITVASGLMGVNPITFSDDGRLFVARDFLGVGLYEMDPEGVSAPTALLPNLVALNAFDFGPDGRLYGPLFFEGRLVSIDVDNPSDMQQVATGFVVPSAVKFDRQGRLFALDQAAGKVYIVNVGTGVKTVYATIESGLDNLAFDSRGQLFVSNNNTGAVYQVYANGAVRTVSPGGVTGIGGLAVLPRARGESVWVASTFAMAEFDGASGKPLTFVKAVLGASDLASPMTAAPDGANLVVASWFSNMVQVWDPARNAIVANYPAATPLNAIRFQGDIVVAELGSPTVPAGVVRIAPSGARTTLATMGMPIGLAARGKDLWVSDCAAGTVALIVRNGRLLNRPLVVARDLQGPEGLAVEADGSLLVVEARAGRLSRIHLPGGKVSVVADGLALGAPGPEFMPPTWTLDAVAVGASGAIYVGGSRANVLYRIN